MIFDKSCYKLLLTNGVRTTYADALALCKLNGGSLTAIESETIYEVLYDYVQRAWSLAVDKEQSNYVDVWLEMRYQVHVLTFFSVLSTTVTLDHFAKASLIRSRPFANYDYESVAANC